MQRTAALLAAFAIAVPLAAQHEKEGEKGRNPAIGDAKAIEAGQKLFAGGCAVCHGSEGQGGRGPNLRERVFWHPLDDPTLFKAVQKGVGAAMPASNLPDDQAWQVVAYVVSLTAPAIESPVSGDGKAGESVFAKGGCGGCHRVNGKGGMLGPDLSNIAAMRSGAQMRESIVDPDADGAQGYRAVTVTLANGKTLKGVARNRTNYSMQLQDAQGNLHLVNMADVTAMSMSKGSPMPKDYAKKLSTGEIDNLVAYLSRLSVRGVDVAKK
ncbi:MAG: c-type cytochrome [Bryobacteraceae bacterium]